MNFIIKRKFRNLLKRTMKEVGLHHKQRVCWQVGNRFVGGLEMTCRLFLSRIKKKVRPVEMRVVIGRKQKKKSKECS